jgi:hypothetical protein
LLLFFVVAEERCKRERLRSKEDSRVKDDILKGFKKEEDALFCLEWEVEGEEFERNVQECE